MVQRLYTHGRMTALWIGKAIVDVPDQALCPGLQLFGVMAVQEGWKGIVA